MGGINFCWLAVWFPSPDWLCRILEECDVYQALRWSCRTWGRECGPCPDFASNTLAFALQLKKITENLSQGNRMVLGCSAPNAIRFVDLAIAGDGLDWPAVPCHPWLSRQVTGSTLGQLKYLLRCHTRGFPTSANLDSKLSVRALMWSANSGTPRSSCICLLLTYQGAPVARWRHLDCNTSTMGNHFTSHAYLLYQLTNGRTVRPAGAQNKRRPSKRQSAFAFHYSSSTHQDRNNQLWHIKKEETMSNYPVHDALWTGHTTAQLSMLPAALVLLLHQPWNATNHRGPLVSLSCASKWYIFTRGGLDASSLIQQPCSPPQSTLLEEPSSTQN